MLDPGMTNHPDSEKKQTGEFTDLAYFDKMDKLVPSDQESHKMV
jgi:hypothetical protein